MMRGALAVRDVVKVHDPAGARLLAVDRCSFDIAAGEICMIVGPSGCGKTTLLGAIAGFHGLDAGSIHLDGVMLCGPGRLQAPVGPDRIVVFQNGALFPWKTALQNVAFGPLMQGHAPRDEVFERARALMAEFGLGGFEQTYPGELSSGLRRRVEIARALMNDPAVLLLDEPYRALDALTRSLMHEALIETHRRTCVTIFFITHDIEEAVFLGHRVIVMTSRPGRPKAVLEVDLPHPREHAVRTTPRFRALVHDIATIVRDEAVLAFERGEREAAA